MSETQDARADRLAKVAVSLIVRVRDDPPDDNWRWLRAALPDEADRDALCMVLAAAVPDDQPWWDLTAWRRDEAPRRIRPPRRVRTAAVKPCGTRAAYMRHLAHGEQPCGPCVEAEREYDRARKARSV